MDGGCWISCKPNFLLPVRVLSKLFCRLMAGETSGGTPGGQAAMTRLTRRIWPMSRYSRRSSLHSARSAGSSTPSVRSPVRRPCSPICHGIPTASPSSPSPAEFRTPTSAPSNLHSPSSRPTQPPARSFTGGFRTTAPVQAASSQWAVIRNHSHEETHAPQQNAALLLGTASFINGPG
jgi:hypothetical protein